MRARVFLPFFVLLITLVFTIAQSQEGKIEAFNTSFEVLFFIK